MLPSPSLRVVGMLPYRRGWPCVTPVYSAPAVLSSTIVSGAQPPGRQDITLTEPPSNGDRAELSPRAVVVVEYVGCRQQLGDEVDLVEATVELIQRRNTAEDPVVVADLVVEVVVERREQAC